MFCLAEQGFGLTETQTCSVEKSGTSSYIIQWLLFIFLSPIFSSLPPVLPSAFDTGNHSGL
jgi:VIT1/CCC1 family predicted Fe2+/Mn2+ transporter